MKILKTKVKLSKLKWRHRITALFCALTLGFGAWLCTPTIISLVSNFVNKIALSSAMFALPSISTAKSVAYTR